MQQKRKLSIPESKIDPIYNNWNEIKKKLAKSTKTPHIKEGQVWWCSAGQNIGTEIYGKGRDHSRPVLVYKKLSKLNFMAIPFSTKVRYDSSWYIPLNFVGVKQAAVISQVRVMDVARLHECIGELPESDFIKVQNGFEALYFRKNTPQP